ncbi:hypothetical protein HK101_010520 [Irineochytrium annulatum]|nr:hypothetical protein HK101_010520 [Irineochytrium annulatum]
MSSPPSVHSRESTRAAPPGSAPEPPLPAKVASTHSIVMDPANPDEARAITTAPEDAPRPSIAQEDGAEPGPDRATPPVGDEFGEPPLLDENGEPIQPPENGGDAAVDAEEAAADALALAVADQHELDYRDQMEKRRQALEEQMLDKTKVPASYYSMSKKESLILQYVENFNRQYVQLYPGRKELLLCPENEFGVKKFVCTTIRPTQLPFKEIYDYRSCAKFVADYLTYEPLEPPHELPPKLKSPTYTLKMQSGNSFDYSILLCSLLTGFGYDAFVVCGYATRDITIMDETKTESDAVGIPSPAGLKAYDDDDLIPRNGDDTSKGKYRIKTVRKLQSQFLLKQEEKRRIMQAREREYRRLMAERERELMMADDDELKGLRVHSWVLVLPGKREIAESFFIEPTTGRIYQTDNENYLGVESVFGPTNYWVNMQVCYDGLRGIMFDLGDNSKWEFVLLDSTQPGTGYRNQDSMQENDAASDDDDDDNSLEILDLPPSWVERISLTKEQFESRCPSGQKMICYKNAKCETFAEYHRADGMVSRITFYTDEIRDFHGEIREKFSNRRDKLVERVRTPYIGEVHEYFDPGRPHNLKEHVMVDGETTELHFFPAARPDGLVKRVEGVNKVMEFFQDREDRLSYRSVTYEKADDEMVRTRATIMKMTEKFERNPLLPAHEDPAKKVYLLALDKIKVTYHLEDGRIIASSREFKKPSADQKANYMEVPISFEVNPYLKPPKKQHLYAQLCNLLKTEQVCQQAVKKSTAEKDEILQARQGEEKDVSLVISVYDTIRNSTSLPNEEEKEAHKGEEEESKIANLDYLSPFLVNYRTSAGLVAAEASAVKESCLKSLKERLIEKANIIQTRLEEITAEYQRRQMAYSRNADSMSVEETDEYVRFCNEALFKIHILEKRLAKHKESAPEKYIELDAKLRADTRLAASFEKR